jgi:drug/metabolite transporter (DMT)-like permease
LALFTVATLFSLNYIISKLAMHAFNPLVFAWLRVLGSSMVLQFVLPRDRAPISSADSRALVGLTLLGIVINQALFLTGLTFSSAHIAAIVVSTIPVFALGAAIVLGRERATLSKIGGLGLAAGGALLVVGVEGVEGTQRSLIGAILIVLSSMSYALYLVLAKPVMARISARRMIRRMFVTASVLMIPVAAVPLARQQWSAIPPRAWIALLLVIAGPTVAAYLLNAWALAHSEASLVAAYTYLQPFLTSILAAIYLQERIRPIVGVAAAMIFAGVWLSGRPAPPAARVEAVPGNPD